MIYETDDVRVTEATVAPHTREITHKHARSTVMYLEQQGTSSVYFADSNRVSEPPDDPKFKPIAFGISPEELYDGDMPRIVSIALLLVFSFTLIAPLLALGQTGEANLPACCRKNGKHHCAMSMVERTVAKKSGTQVGAPPEKCPYGPSSIATSGHRPLALVATLSVLGTRDTLPTVIAQTESKWRISRDRSRQKRGPPYLLFI